MLLTLVSPGCPGKIKKNVPPPLDKFLTTTLDPLPLKHKNDYKSSTKPVNGESERDHEVHRVPVHCTTIQADRFIGFFLNFLFPIVKETLWYFNQYCHILTQLSRLGFFFENILLYPLPYIIYIHIISPPKKHKIALCAH